ncbi:hypothetical protein AVEN_122985-1 [Araneus ventricosus]|uniref:Uncharacterized protein n=1 Tax=Araneus ventricosus TaxID=182803 RepID=A0A4Y2CVT8_ARAVE|nr:hypothetical protein AVEN_122985-1 [Araneus ventricosus]
MILCSKYPPSIIYTPLSALKSLVHGVKALYKEDFVPFRITAASNRAPNDWTIALVPVLLLLLMSSTVLAPLRGCCGVRGKLTCGPGTSLLVLVDYCMPGCGGGPWRRLARFKESNDKCRLEGNNCPNRKLLFYSPLPGSGTSLLVLVDYCMPGCGGGPCRIIKKRSYVYVEKPQGN